MRRAPIVLFLVVAAACAGRAAVAPSSPPPIPASAPPCASERTSASASDAEAPRAGKASPLLRDVDASRLSATVAKLASFGTRHTLSDTASPTRGIGAARSWIKAELERAAAESGRTGDGAMQVSFDAHRQAADGQRIPRDVDIVNVMAVLPGEMPEARARRYYVVGHYDSRATDVMNATGDAPGANDDGSGTAVVMELARVMSKARFDATLVFLATACEEQALCGAKLHAEAARKAGWDVRAVLNDDIVGDPSPVLAAAPHDREIRVFSEGIPLDADAGDIQRIRRIGAENDSPSRELARFVADVAEEEGTTVRPILVFRPDRFLRGGDHLAFAQLGFPAVRFTVVEEHFDRQHQDVHADDAGRPYGDVPEFVQGPYLAGVATLDGVVLAHLANAPSPPKDARVVTAGLANDTLLRWSPSPEPDVAGYEVVWRKTTSARWQEARDAGARTELRVPVSKDDVFFGVRAYDKDGWKSPVAFAAAAKE